MTEARLAELFAGLAGFRGSLLTHAGDLAELAEHLRAAGLPTAADLAERIAVELATGLAALTRLADDAQDDTLVGVPVVGPGET